MLDNIARWPAMLGYTATWPAMLRNTARWAAINAGLHCTVASDALLHSTVASNAVLHSMVASMLGYTAHWSAMPGISSDCWLFCFARTIPQQMPHGSPIFINSSEARTMPNTIMHAAYIAAADSPQTKTGGLCYLNTYSNQAMLKIKRLNANHALNQYNKSFS